MVSSQFFLEAAADAKQLIQRTRPLVESMNKLTNQIRGVTNGHGFHISMLLHSEVPIETRRHSAEWLSNWIWRNSRRSANPTVSRVIGTLQSENNLPHNLGVHEYLDQFLKPEAVILAASESKNPQRIRLGSQWIKNGDGEIAIVSPLELSVTRYDKWFIQRSRAIYSELILDNGPTIIVGEPVRKVYEQEVLQSGRTVCALDSLIAAESAQECSGEVLQLLERVGPGVNRSFLEELRRIFQENPDLQSKQAFERTRQRLGLSSNNLHQILSRIRKQI